MRVFIRVTQGGGSLPKTSPPWPRAPSAYRTDNTFRVRCQCPSLHISTPVVSSCWWLWPHGLHVQPKPPSYPQHVCPSPPPSPSSVCPASFLGGPTYGSEPTTPFSPFFVLFFFYMYYSPRNVCHTFVPRIRFLILKIHFLFLWGRDQT